MAADTKLPSATRQLTPAHKELLHLLAETFVEQLYAEPQEETCIAVEPEEDTL